MAVAKEIRELAEFKYTVRKLTSFFHRLGVLNIPVTIQYTTRSSNFYTHERFYLISDTKLKTESS